MFVSAALPVVLCMYNFVLNCFQFQLSVSYFVIVSLSWLAGERLVDKAFLYFRLVCTSGWFVQLANNKICFVNPNANNSVFKRTFGAGTLKTFKNFQPQTKLDVLFSKKCDSQFLRDCIHSSPFL